MNAKISNRRLRPFTRFLPGQASRLGERASYNTILTLVQHRHRDSRPGGSHYSDREELNAIIEDPLNQEIVRTSTSHYAAPVTLVKKKDGSLRLCINYRDLNAQTIKNAFPLPRMGKIITQLDGNKYFATLNLASSYWQIEVPPKTGRKPLSISLVVSMNSTPSRRA